MANPQPTDAHLRMAHSINEAIMMRDFSKHQRKILDLILRLSWGCHKKYAYIPRQKDFMVVGIFEGDIKKELDWLEVSQIIGRSGPYYWFNKDFEQWQVSRVRPYNPELLSELLSSNLDNNQPLLSELLSSNPKLSVLLSDNFGKHEEKTSENTKFTMPNLASPKESIKESNNTNNKEIKDNDEFWPQILNELKQGMSNSNFRTWFGAATGCLVEDRYFIQVPNQFCLEYLRSNQRSYIEKVICGVIGRPIEVSMIINRDGNNKG